MYFFLAVSRATLHFTQQSKRNTAVFSLIKSKKLCISKMYFMYTYVLFDTQILNSMLSPLDF